MSFTIASNESSSLGPAKRCQGNDLCCASAPTAGVGLFSIGNPRSAIVGECRMCSHFFCGACATRTLSPIYVGTSAVFAWRLGCPFCGLPLGDPLSFQAVLFSSHSGVVELKAEQQETWSVVEPSPSLMQNGYRKHQLRGLGELAVLFTAASHEERIAAVDRSLNEAPGEPLAWIFKAIFCLAEKNNYAARIALDRITECGKEDPLILVLLGPNLAIENLSRPEVLRSNLTHFSQSLSARKGLLHPDLLKFDARVQSFANGTENLGDYVRTLFGQTEPPKVARDYLQLVRLEMALDTAGTEADRREMMKILVDKLSKEETQALIDLSMALRNGAISTTDFYAEFQKLLEHHGVDLSPWPRMMNYLRYVSGAAVTDFSELYQQIWATEQESYDSLIQSDQEAKIVLDLTRIRVATRMIETLEGSAPNGQLAANVAKNPLPPESAKPSAKQGPIAQQGTPSTPTGFFGRLMSWFKK